MIEVLSKISSILYFIIKYVLLKMYLVEKKSGWIDLQYKIIITKYLNIAIAFHQTRACTRDCSEQWQLQYISQ